jgi:tetratricopeptide (TPR) repeat protein
MIEDAWSALEELEPDSPLRTSPDVLRLWLKILASREKWDEAVLIGQTLCKAVPHEEQAFLDTASCLHELGRTREAKRTLLEGPNSLMNNAAYHYNLGCYEAVLGNVEHAKSCIKRAVEMDKAFEKVAVEDRDLAAIWPALRFE